MHKQFTHCVVFSVRRKYIQPPKIILELLPRRNSSKSRFHFYQLYKFMWNLLIRILSAVVKVTGAHLFGFCIIAFSEKGKYYS